MNWKVNEGLLGYIEDEEVLSNIVTGIVGLLYINKQQKEKDINFFDKIFLCTEHYRFLEFYLNGFTVCWSSLDQRFSSQLSPDGFSILFQLVKSILRRLFILSPFNSQYFLQSADFLFEVISFFSTFSG